MLLVRAIRVVSILLCIACLRPVDAASQSFDACGFLSEGVAEEVFEKSTRVSSAANPQNIRALFILADFTDGTNQDLVTPADCSECDASYPGCVNPGPHPWPDGSSTPPAWALDLLQDYDAPQVLEGSLSEYYDLMSNGCIRLRGKTYDKVVNLGSIVDMRSNYPQNAVGNAIRLAIEAVDNDPDPQWSYAEFDNDGPDNVPDSGDDDGMVDFVFVAFRELRNVTGFYLTSSTYPPTWTLGGVAELLQTSGSDIQTNDGIAIPNNFGALLTHNPKIIGFDDMVEIAAHEIGHGTHPYFSGVSHYPSLGGYALMHGTTGSRGRAAYISTQTRSSRGWIDPVREFCTDGPCPTQGSEMLSPGDTAIVSLKDVGGYPDQGFIKVRPNASGEVFILECRDPSATHFTDGAGTSTGRDPCNPRRGPTGVFVTHIDGSRYPVMPGARFDLTTLAPDPISGKNEITSTGNAAVTSHNGAFGPGVAPVLAPYTNPNTNNSSLAQQVDDLYSGLSFYNFEWITPPNVDGEGEIRFTIRYDGPTEPAGPHPLPPDMKWDGVVQLTQDVEVPAEGRLEITANSMIVASSGADQKGTGVDQNTVEIVVNGELDARGTIGSEIVFTTSDDPDFRTGYLKDWIGTPTPPDLDGWYGLRYLQQSGLQSFGCSVPDDGQTNSNWIEHASLRAAIHGIAIENTAAPTIKSVEFQDSHLFVDETDVYVPLVYDNCQPIGGWELGDGTEVRVTSLTDPANDILGRTPGKVDIVAHGRINIISSDPANVSIGPENPPVGVSSGDLWGGIFMDRRSRGSSVTGAKIGHAINPLRFNGPDGDLVDNCSIHQFADKGVWATDGTGSGVTISNCAIDRGDLDSDSKGSIGIQLARCYESIVSDNTLDMPLPAAAPDGAGIRIRNQPAVSKVAATEPLEIVGNTINGLTVSPGAAIDADWIDDAILEDNDINDWSTGMLFTESRDLQLSCNLLTGVDVGVSIASNWVTQPGLRFRLNSIKAASIGILTDNGFKTKLGTAGATNKKGRNIIEVEAGGSLVHRTDAGSSHDLQAQQNTWRVDQVLMNDENDVRMNCTDNDGGLLVDQIMASQTRSDEFVQCGFMFSNPGPTSEPETGSISNSSVQFESPFRSTSVIRYHVKKPGHTTLRIYSLAGRLVREFVDKPMSPGEYSMTWDGTTESGQDLASGVFFIRYANGGVEETTRLVLLR